MIYQLDGPIGRLILNYLALNSKIGKETNGVVKGSCNHVYHYSTSCSNKRFIHSHRIE